VKIEEKIKKKNIQSAVVIALMVYKSKNHDIRDFKISFYVNYDV